MNQLPFSAKDRAELYANDHHLTIEKQIGGGVDGIVLGTNQKTAIKSLNHVALYRQERDVYLHLKRKRITKVNDFQVPALIDTDDRLAVVEMTIVSPPFVVDFAGASLVGRPPFEPDIWNEWLLEKQEQFESDWPRVKSLIWAFEREGVFLSDVHPGNVRCR